MCTPHPATLDKFLTDFIQIARMSHELKALQLPLNRGGQLNFDGENHSSKTSHSTTVFRFQPQSGTTCRLHTWQVGAPDQL